MELKYSSLHGRHLHDLGELFQDLWEVCLGFRRQKHLSLKVPYRPSTAALDLLVDSTGIKFLGEGEWKRKKHGADYRRQWRKVHLAIDALSHWTSRSGDGVAHPRALLNHFSQLGRPVTVAVA